MPFLVWVHTASEDLCAFLHFYQKVPGHLAAACLTAECLGDS